MKDQAFEQQCEEYLTYLYDLATCKYGDCPDIESLIQDTIMVFLIKKNKGEAIEYPKGFLASVLKNKHNGWLRSKYRNNVILYDYTDIPDTENELLLKEENDIRAEEYEAVRREIGRLINIYREVTVRHYVYGHSVEQIASDLNISCGTVKSRLSNARTQIKEGINTMEKYSDVSYMPKSLSLGIWGGAGFHGEPFSLLNSPIEENILILAYESPVSVRGISDSLGMPAAYIEALVDRLVEGELMGKTSGGLVFTRCFIMNYEDSFGNIVAQEAIAEKHAKKLAETVIKHLAPLSRQAEFVNLSEKQKATLYLFTTQQALNSLLNQCRPAFDKEIVLPERPNGGRWLASGKVLQHGGKQNNIYDGSGPVCVSYSMNGVDCRMFDTQSCFGDAHWAYGRLKYKLPLQTVLRFYASLKDDRIQPDNQAIYDMIPDFERLNIIKRNEDGKIILDIPALTFETNEKYLNPVIQNISAEVKTYLETDIVRLYSEYKNRVPKHVDAWQYYETEGVTGALTRAIMLEMVKCKYLPYPVTVGKTPIIFLLYRKR